MHQLLSVKYPSTYESDNDFGEETFNYRPSLAERDCSVVPDADCCKRYKFSQKFGPIAIERNVSTRGRPTQRSFSLCTRDWAYLVSPSEIFKLAVFQTSQNEEEWGLQRDHREVKTSFLA